MVLPFLWTHIYPTQNTGIFLMPVSQLSHSRVFPFTPNNLVPGCHNIFCECFLQLHFYKEGNTSSVLDGELDYKGSGYITWCRTVLRSPDSSTKLSYGNMQHKAIRNTSWGLGNYTVLL